MSYGRNLPSRTEVLRDLIFNGVSPSYPVGMAEFPEETLTTPPFRRDESALDLRAFSPLVAESLQAGEQLSFEEAQPVFNQDEFTLRDLTSVQEYYKVELGLSYGLFRGNLSKEGVETQLSVIQYLCAKYGAGQKVNLNPHLECQLKRLDESAVFSSLEDAIFKITRKRAKVPAAWIAEIKEGLVLALKEIEASLLTAEEKPGSSFLFFAPQPRTVAESKEVVSPKNSPKSD